MYLGLQTDIRNKMIKIKKLIANKKRYKNQIKILSIILIITLSLFISLINIYGEEDIGTGLAGIAADLVRGEQITIEPGKTQDISEKLGYNNPVRVNVPEGGESVNFNLDKRSFEGVGDFKVSISDGNNQESRVYQGFNKRNVGKNKLVFDENMELTDGTNFESDGGKKNEGEEKEGREIDIKGYKLKLNEGDVVNIQNGKTEIGIQKEGDKKIIPPEKVEREVKSLGEDEKPEFKFKTEGDNVKIYPKKQEEGISLKGSLSYIGGDAFHRQGEDLNIGFRKTEDGKFIDKSGVEIGLKSDNLDFSEGKEARLFFDSNKIPEDYKGAGIVLDKPNNIIEVFSTGDTRSSAVKMNSANDFINLYDSKAVRNELLQDGKIRNLVIQAGVPETGGKAMVKISDKGLDKPEMIIQGKDSRANIDYGGIRIEEEGGKGNIMIKANGLQIKGLGEKGDSTFPMKIIYKNSQGEALDDYKIDLHVNAQNKFAMVPESYDFDSTNGYYYPEKNGPPMSPRLKYNYLPQEQQEFVAKLAREENEKYQELVNKNFFDLTPEKQKEYLVELKKWPNNKDPKIEPLIPTPKPIPIPEPNPEPIKINPKNWGFFYNYLGDFNPNKQDYFVLKIGSEGCGPCKRFDSESGIISSQISKIKFSKADYYDNPEFFNKCGANSWPTFLVFDKNGKFITRMQGYMGVDDFTSKLNNLLR